jgi:methyl-accepting chemotaxis protein
MKNKISFKFLSITALMFAGMALAIGIVIAELNAAAIRRTAEASVNDYVNNISSNMGVIDELLRKHVNSSMEFLRTLGRNAGVPNISGTTLLKGQAVPNLRLGGSSQVENYRLVDEILSATEATATLFVRKGDSFLRVSTNVKKDDGSRAIGTELDPAGKAYKNIIKGESFYGAVDILGKPYLTGYEPMFDKDKNIIGVWYVGFPVSAMHVIGERIESSVILENGYIALVDYKGRVIFRSKHISENLIAEHLKAEGTLSDWVIRSQDFSPWNYKIVSAYPHEDVNSQVRSSLIRTIIILTAAASLLLLIVFFLLRSFVLNSVHKLSEASEKIAKGDYSVLVKTKSKDEFGKLSDTFNLMIANIRSALEEAHQKGAEARVALEKSEKLNKEISAQQDYLSRNTKMILQGMEKFAEGDLTVELKPEKDDEIGRLINGFNASVNNVKKMIIDVSETVSATASAAGEISSGSSQMASGAQEQTKQIAEIAAAIEEMSKTIMETARNVNMAADVSKQAGGKAKEGGEAMNKTANGMNNIAEVVAQAAINVQELGKSGEQIGEIIQVIDDIADQTNLLALNAAIEAARAGEQGRGFAVVADEVRKLAERTTKATKEIAETIKTIQKNTIVTVESIEKGADETNRGRTLASKTGEYLKEIIDNSDKTAEVVLQVAAATEEQSAAAEQISKNVESVSNIAEESSAGAMQIAKAADDLNRLAVQLQNLVNRFKIDSLLKSA